MTGRITSMEFEVMSRASGQARPGAHRFSGTATGAMARTFAAWSRVRRSKHPAAYARKVLLSWHLPEPSSPDGLPRHASCVIAAGTARWSHPYRPCPRRARAQGIRESPAVNDGSLRSGAASSKGRSMSWPAGDRVVGAGNCRRPGSGCQSPDHVVQPQRRSLNAGSCWCRAVWLRASSSAGGAAGVM
jgi:hypothetical protein